MNGSDYDELLSSSVTPTGAGGSTARIIGGQSQMLHLLGKLGNSTVKANQSSIFTKQSARLSATLHRRLKQRHASDHINVTENALELIRDASQGRDSPDKRRKNIEVSVESQIS